MRSKQAIFLSIVFLGIVCVVASLYIQNLYFLRVSTLAVITAILAVSVNLLVGYTGQISLGHAGFYGIGAYSFALLTTHLNWPIWLSFLTAFILSGLMGLVLGLPTTKLKGHFLGIATLGFGIIVNVVLNNWISITGGPVGIRNIPIPSVFGISLQYENYFLSFTVACLLIIILLVYFVISSAIGRAWRCIKRDEISAEVSGINVYGYKLLAFSLSGGIAGIAGSLYASFMTFVSPEAFDSNQSITIITTVILGGAGTLVGPLLGTGIITVLNESLRDFQELRLIIYGLLLVVFIVFMPQGIYLFIKERAKSLWMPKKQKNLIPRGQKQTKEVDQ
ncbi:branched-chain amino acid ABC transporter permease [Niallia sp. 03133]|uniref:branched-chain amino acid ABC transporter permease n=1 Tax=Niallia sp. 03133 TaxID=3458060 RepID=UPI00404422EA